MADTLKKLTKQGLQDYVNLKEPTKLDWIKEHKAQIVAVVSQILWSSSTESAIAESENNPNGLQDVHDNIVSQLTQMT